MKITNEKKNERAIFFGSNPLRSNSHPVAPTHPTYSRLFSRRSQEQRKPLKSLPKLSDSLARANNKSKYVPHIEDHKHFLQNYNEY